MCEIKGGYKGISLQPCIHFHVRFLNLNSLLGKYGAQKGVLKGLFFVILFSKCLHTLYKFIFLASILRELYHSPDPKFR